MILGITCGLDAKNDVLSEKNAQKRSTFSTEIVVTHTTYTSINEKDMRKS
jgi:hypothetical protein